MKKCNRILSLVLTAAALFSLLAVWAFGAEKRVLDEADLLSSFEEQKLEEQFGRIEETYGFIVATPGKETLETLSATEMVTVFVPTAPNPTSGYVIMVERDKLHKTSATIEQAFKFHVSLGVMTPEGALRGASEKRDASAENQAKKPAG